VLIAIDELVAHLANSKQVINLNKSQIACEYVTGWAGANTVLMVASRLLK
jgi:hypothetical protein